MPADRPRGDKHALLVPHESREEATMVRRFVDARGMEWEVWEAGLKRMLADAPARKRSAEPTWLCFASATQRRRLVRYPPWWHALSPVELDRLCAAAELEPVRPPLSPPPQPRG
jgi:hypothetical protein